MAARNPFASSIPDIYDPYGLAQSSRAARLPTAYYFIRNLLVVGAIAGGLVAAYRNDAIRELARRVGQEDRYLSAEKFLVGTPGWGTPRSMEPVLAETAAVVEAPLAAPAAPTAETSQPAAAEPPSQPAAAAPAPEPPPAAPAAVPEPPAAAPVVVAERAPAAVAPPPAAPPAAPEPPRAAAPPVDPMAPVSFDSLPTLAHGGAPKAAAFEQLPPTRAAAPAPVPVARAAAPAVSRPAAAPVDHSRAKAIHVSLDEAPTRGGGRSIPAPRPAAAPPPEPAPAPPPPAPKPSGPKYNAAEAHRNDNPLMAAVRGAVRSRPPKESVPAAK
jgi:hypothetical protein